MGTTQSVISLLEKPGGTWNRINTLVRVAKALDRYLVVSFPTEVPDMLADAVQVAWRGLEELTRRNSRDSREQWGAEEERRRLRAVITLLAQ
jgi:hypothetical protein